MDEVLIVLLFHGALREASTAGLCPSSPPLLLDSLNPFSLLAVHDGFRFPIGPKFQKDATNVLRERFLGDVSYAWIQLVSKRLRLSILVFEGSLFW